MESGISRALEEGYFSGNKIYTNCLGSHQGCIEYTCLHVYLLFEIPDHGAEQGPVRRVLVYYTATCGAVTPPRL